MAEDKNTVDPKNNSQENSGGDGKPPVILAHGQTRGATSHPTKLKFMLVGLVLLLIVVLGLALSLSGGGDKKKINTLDSEDSSEDNGVANNNSAGYLQSPNGNFSSEVKLNTGYALPVLMVSKNDEVNLGEQVLWQNGFAAMATSIERDYRPASEFNYKKIAESGDELVRVNFVVGNASDKSMAIGYDDLGLYALTDDGVKKQSERISEDVYSPKNGQTLGAKQTQTISLHFRVKRGSHFNVVKSQTFDQKKARPNKGEERNPVLNLLIKLP